MPSSSDYTPLCPPSVPFSPESMHFISTFYSTSDTPAAHSAYVSHFLPSAALTMASTTVQGSTEILALRRKMWEHVAARKHSVEKVFPFGAGSNEVAIFGTVDYVLKEGGKKIKEVPWAARGVIGEAEEGRKVWERYQVYLDTAARDKK